MSDLLTKVSDALAGRYRLEREIGSGAMATVYLAHDVKHDREVAFKVLRPELSAVLGVERFLKEIAITAKLDHPHILTLIDSGTADGFLYYVLPFVRGESLRERLRRERQLSLEDAVAITKQVASALEYAHRQGVIHRDVKPENILLHEGEAMLTDFGIALAVKEAAGNRLTDTGRSPGTPQYMSPEQAYGDRVLDARSDVYSLAAVLYEMLASEPPHSGPNAQAIIAKLLTEKPVRLRRLRDTVPDGIEAAVSKALALIPADRHRDAGEFARALVVPSSAPREAKQLRRWIPIVVGTSVVAAVLAGAVVASRRKPPLPLIDRIQLTATGNATLPAISQDGSRLSFGEKQCDADGNCTYRLVIQDVDGTGRLVIADSLGSLGNMEWTRDGKYLIYGGSYGPTRWGMFAVSTLGGTPRFIGCCSGVLLSGDTVSFFRFLPAGDSLAWVNLASARGGMIRDSIPIVQPGIRFSVIPSGYSDRLLVLVRRGDETVRELRLIDRRGAVIARSRAGFDVGDRRVFARGMPDRSEVLVSVQREIDDDQYDFLRIRFDASRIDPVVDTVLQQVAVGDGVFSVSRDGARLTYAAGPVETAIWASELGAKAPAHVDPRPLFNATAVAFARISPSGEKVLLGRQVLSGGRKRYQLFTTPIAAWKESQITGPLDGLVDARWATDGTRIVYATGSGPQVHIMDVDTAGSPGREIASVNRAVAKFLAPLRDGGVAAAAPDSRSISVFGRRGVADGQWIVPRWISSITSMSPSPDGLFLGVLGWDRGIDSAVVAVVNLRSGTFTRRATVPAEIVGSLSWLDDQSMTFDIQESRGAWALYVITPNGVMKRSTTLPHAPAEYNVASNGRRFLSVSQSDKRDVQMIRNFGDFLSR